MNLALMAWYDFGEYYVWREQSTWEEFLKIRETLKKQMSNSDTRRIDLRNMTFLTFSKNFLL